MMMEHTDLQSDLKSMVKELIYEVNTKFQLGLEDPKQATIHLTSTLRLKGGLGIQKGAKNSCSSKGIKVAAP